MLTTREHAAHRKLMDACLVVTVRSTGAELRWWQCGQRFGRTVSLLTAFALFPCGRGNATNTPEGVCDRNPSLMSVASAVRHCRSSTCHNRHACADVSFSPGRSVNSARMRSISVCREDMTPPAVAQSQVVESEAGILLQLVGTLKRALIISGFTFCPSQGGRRRKGFDSAMPGMPAAGIHPMTLWLDDRRFASTPSRSATVPR
jgi:hypothetical protein